MEKPNSDPEKPAVKAHMQEVRKVTESPARQAKTKKAKGAFPWLRILLFLAYIALIAGLVVTERKALEGLSDAKAREGKGDFAGALEGYEGVRDGYPFSFSTIEAYDGIQRVANQGGATPQPPVKPPVLGEFIGEELAGATVYWLPFVCWPVCALLLGLVFLTRILRIGLAFLSLILCAAAAAGTAIQSSWYGLYTLPQLAEVSKAAMTDPLVLFGATYGLMVITALMTLTRTRRCRRK